MGEEGLWNTELFSACCRAVPKERGSTVINGFQEAWGFSLAKGKLLVSIPTLQTRFSAYMPVHKSAVNVLMVTCQVFPWMLFYRQMLLQPQVIRADEEPTDRGDLVRISRRCCLIGAALCPELL